jgi:hypothetical protein
MENIAFNRFSKNRRNQIQNQNQRFQNQTHIQNQPKSSISSMIYLLFAFIIAGIFYFIYRSWNEIQKRAQLFPTSLYMFESEEETNKEALCKSGCKAGKCIVGSGDCKVDTDCEVCVDEKGGFYGSVTNLKDEVAALEEEDVIQDRRIRELEKMIQDRNQQIADLNRYIEYVNRTNKVHESESDS